MLPGFPFTHFSRAMADSQTMIPGPAASAPPWNAERQIISP